MIAWIYKFNKSLLLLAPWDSLRWVQDWDLTIFKQNSLIKRSFKVLEQELQVSWLEAQEFIQTEGIVVIFHEEERQVQVVL